MLNGKNILLGITGGIAAYKTTFLVRLLIKAGANVKIVLTESASSFVSSLTLATLSKNPVVSNFVKTKNHTTDWNNHVKLGLWADLMLIAPATANTLSKMASGTSDNLLLACYLSAKCPVLFAPAMDLDMYHHPTTKKSFDTLQSYGNIMIPATSGELASGLYGEGRMAEPEDIMAFIQNYLSQGLPLKNKKVLITAGPTYEAIDPVRFIGNHSSGLMGFELANAAANLGATVILVSGPSQYTIEKELVQLIKVISADEMYLKAHEHFPDADIVICAAAVADYKPKVKSEQKIKKSDKELQLELVKNRDILLSFGQEKQSQYLVGFALETENEIENAKGKLKRKNLDAIILNSLNDQGAGFGGNTNKISFIDTNLEIQTFDLKTKAAVAKDILNEIVKRRYA
ncbi:bifunctional phosphopantothenoylcysteine decarboxylase/phosphopantothenate--cysteine ligase CoaBC [Maribacter sp. PR1]|uniref:Coenzyme A biosynthesis bifunctional protein CoaBC n=1 Tax=Maribacter cobaltidurans TaxID=1178778 RepID=A0ABU7IT50_9FLAO|nr:MULTISPECIES: bifunctional phosphopantothenoylcysteine decarboxylase/phosphopantothenate--cysteine ligase CoaBC [Maribacter]MDC6388317.1 bifunctional phosphopantothenoylcysteine decarboxylase/phosphopantothenate--cysteine ligase CoaBC [Maribacter sp. PR1]MEE1975706.1 bifunctional phosphopantothenoylcysteine decarboxylase/phosphopantothenate--cysteine ligase CoaBC [Maribacter cobaltidurans]